MMPPTNITPSELWAACTTMPRPFKIVPFPRKGEDGKPIGELALRALTQQEQIQAGIEAEKLVRAELPDAKKDASEGYAIAYSNAAAVSQLFRACRDPSNLEAPVFPSPKAMRTHLTTDEIGALYSAFLDVCAEIGPVIGTLTAAESEAWIDRLVEGGEASDPFAYFSSAALRVLLRASIARLASSTTPQSSPGSQPDAIELEKTDDSLGDDAVDDTLDDHGGEITPS